MAKTIRYMIMNTDNSGLRSTMGKEFKTKKEAKEFIKKLLSKPSFNVSPTGKRIYHTRYRDAISGTGINNPRIIKRVVNR